MSRTQRRATRRNTYHGNLPEFYGPRIDARTMRDGKAIRGCPEGSCDYCAGNRLHSTIVRRIAADDEIRED